MKKAAKEQEEDEQKTILPKSPLQQIPSKDEVPMSEVGSLIRLFISSTFTDFEFEREVLQGTVFPQLRTLCAAAGCRFQPIDLRWGVSQEAGNDKRTLAICLEEVARCQRLSPDLNFLILLGERYGSCFLPEHIPSEQVARLWPHLQDIWRDRFRAAYTEDHNALPPEYVLRPGPGSGDMGDAEEALRAALAQATVAAGFSEQEHLPFVASATHLEIQRGLLDSGCDPHATLCAFRSFSSVLAGSQLARYGETQPEQQARVEALKAAIAERLGEEHIWHYMVPVESLPLVQAAREDSPEYQAMASQFYALLKPRIQEAIALRKSAIQTKNLEMLANHQFASTHTVVVVGREKALEQVAAYLAGSTPRPLVVTGESGVGKSTLLARAMQDMALAHPQAVVVTRYIGVTPGTGSLADLLAGLHREIAERYGQAPPESLGDLSQQVAAFAAYLRTRSPSVERPLILVVDALDQLGSERQRVDWLPSALAPSVRVVVSVSSERQELDLLRAWLPAEQILPLNPLTRAQGADALQQWLSEVGRRLTPAQETAVLDGFAPADARVKGTGTPLYLRLAFEQVRTWRSFDPVKPLPPTVPALLDQYFKRLEEPGQHGQELVAYALGYLAAARHGLAEDELLDLLPRNDLVRTSLQELSPGSPPIDTERPLPMALWARLAADLAWSLTERETNGARLITFYHQQVREETAQNYLNETARPARHTELAAYFGGQPYREGIGGEGIWNRRKLAELAYQQAESGSVGHETLQFTLTDGRFLEGKLAMEGVAATLDDLTLIPGEETIAELAQTIRAGSVTLTKEPSELRNQITGRGGPVTLLHDLPERTTSWLRLRTQSLTPSGPALLHILEEHTNSVPACAFSADGRLALSASWDGTLRLWDTTSGRSIRILKGHTASVIDCSLSADGHRALSISSDETLRLWDTASGQCLRTLETNNRRTRCCALSADGRLALFPARDPIPKKFRTVRMLFRELMPSNDSKLQLWDTTSDQPPRVFKDSGSVQTCAFSADGRLALSASSYTSSLNPDRTLRLWDTTTGRLVHIFEGHTESVTSCSLSADGRLALSASEDDHTLRLWDTTTGRSLRVFKEHYGKFCALSADNRWVLTGSPNGGELRLRDTTSGQVVRVFKGHPEGVSSGALSTDGRLALSASRDGTLRLWDIAKGQPGPTLKSSTGSVHACAFSADGRLALSASSLDRTVQVWDTVSGQLLRVFKGHTMGVSGFALSADGRSALSVSDDHTLLLWDTASGQLLRVFKGKHTRCALSADGKQALSTFSDHTLRLWDTATGQSLHVLVGHSKVVTDCAFSADGRLVLSASFDKTLRLWDTTTGRSLHVLKGHTERINDCAFSADGRLVLSASFDKTLRLWDTATGQCLHVFTGHTEGVRGCTFSADGRLILSASWDKTLRLWGTATGQCLRAFAEHTERLSDWALSADVKRILSASSDGTLRLWDAVSGQEIARWTHDTPLTCCALSADGQRAIGGDEMGGLHFLEVVAPPPVTAPDPTPPTMPLQPDFRDASHNWAEQELAEVGSKISRVWELPVRLITHGKGTRLTWLLPSIILNVIALIFASHLFLLPWLLIIGATSAVLPYGWIGWNHEAWDGEEKGTFLLGMGIPLVMALVMLIQDWSHFGFAEAIGAHWVMLYSQSTCSAGGGVVAGIIGLLMLFLAGVGMLAGFYGGVVGAIVIPNGVLRVLNTGEADALISGCLQLLIGALGFLALDLFGGFFLAVAGCAPTF